MDFLGVGWPHTRLILALLEPFRFLMLLATAFPDSTHWSALQWLVGMFTRNLVREGLMYLLAAGFMWFLFHVFLRRRFQHRVIAQWPARTDIRREMAYSVSTLLIFSGIGLVVLAQLVWGRFTLYWDPRQYGWVWLLVSLPLMLLWHDFYFYWSHRLLHSRWLFRHVHGVHHRSRHPSPWAAYAFHPLEAVVNGLVVPLALCAVPLHGLVLLAFSIHQIVRNAHGHAAVETMPRGFARHWLGGRFSTTTHHHLHHETAKGNYGLWFTWWDRLCKTENPHYMQRFDAVTAPPVRSDF